MRLGLKLSRLDHTYPFCYNSFTQQTELKMGFETVVLDKVAKVLGASNAASFDYGTLFVVALPEDADKVFQMLSGDYPNRVEMNACGGEFAYDFV